MLIPFVRYMKTSMTSVLHFAVKDFLKDMRLSWRNPNAVLILLNKSSDDEAIVSY